MTLSTIYNPSIRNVFTMFHAGLRLLLGSKVVIAHEMTCKEFSKMVIDDLRGQIERGEEAMTYEELRGSFISELNKPQ